MSDFNEGINLDSEGPDEQNEGASNIFLDMNEKDTVTGIPSLKQAPVSAISASASSSKVNPQLVIAACVMAIGGGAIYAMRYIGMRAGLDENIVSIDYTSENNALDLSNRFDTVLKTLDKSTISVQFTSTESFATKPFARPSAIKDEPAQVDTGMSNEERLALKRKRERERELELRHDSIVAEARRFKLQGIIGGARPAARISGQPVRSGMSLGEYFTVTKITGRTVIIEADGMSFELSMGQETVQLD